MHTKHKRRGGEQNDMSFLYILKKCLLFIPVFCIISIIMIFLLSFIFYRTEDSKSKIDLCGILCLYFSTAITTLMLSKSSPAMGPLGGSVFGALIFIFTYLISLFFEKSDTGVQNILLRLGVILISFIVSLMIQRIKCKNRKRRRHG